MSDFDKDRPRRIRAWRSAGLYLPQSKQAARKADDSEKPADGGGVVVNKLTGGKRAEG
jgi:hypothetical protein